MPRKRPPYAFDIYYLGYWFAELGRDLERATSWRLVRAALEALGDYKSVISLEFIGEGAKELIEDVGEYQSDDTKPLKTRDRQYVLAKLKEWEGRVSELNNKWILSVTEVTLDIDRLLDGISSFLSDKELGLLAPIELHGLNEAAKCLLHNSFTSSEFVALRTAESLLRRWYQHKTSKELKRERWGDILNELNNLYPKVSERPKELSLLDYLRNRRNEIDHPEAISTPDKAAATFLNVIDVCKAIMNEL